MFKFDFDLQDDIDETQDFVVGEQKPDLSNVAEVEVEDARKTFGEIPLEKLVDSLPPLISYSPLQVTLSSGQQIHLARRDLYDARFQLIARPDEDDTGGEEKKVTDEGGLRFFDAPSDLVPGVYEGGLKTWECSLDLVAYLDGLQESYQGKRMLELGCGTAVPSLYILNKLFSALRPSPVETSIHLQDYNQSVLELITLPNILLAWYLSPASLSYRDSAGTSDSRPPADPTLANELTITSSLIEAFLAYLSSMKTTLRFFYGSWDSFDLSLTGGRYDIVFTSETIYRTENLPSLVQLLSDTCVGPKGDNDLETVTQTKLSLSSSQSRPSSCYICLVAAKVLYFGVGGGIPEFVRAVEDPRVYPCTNKKRRKGKVHTVWEKTGGVGRKILRICWQDSEVATQEGEADLYFCTSSPGYMM